MVDMPESARIRAVKRELGIDEAEDFLELPKQCLAQEQPEDIEYATVPAEFWDLPLPEPKPPHKPSLRERITWSNFVKCVVTLVIVISMPIITYMYGQFDR